MMSMPMDMITTVDVDCDNDELTRAGFRWRVHPNGVRVLACVPLEAQGFINAFSTRAGGCSALPTAGALNLAGFDGDAAANIHENRRRFLELFDEGWTLAVCWQMHGTDVHLVADAAAVAHSEGTRADAVATDTPCVLVGVKTADCVPIVLGDARTGACAAVHAGWRGAAASIVVRALERMRAAYGTHPADVCAAIGPAALSCCYEVGTEVLDAFRARFAYADKLFTPTRPEHACIDLHEANRRQLLDAGLDAARIHAAPLCTMCRPDLFFSYRRDRPLYGRTGRLLSVIGREETMNAATVNAELKKQEAGSKTRSIALLPAFRA